MLYLFAQKIYKRCKNHVNIPPVILNLGRERHTINQFVETPLFYGLPLLIMGSQEQG